MEMTDKMLRPWEWRISQYKSNLSRADVREYTFAEKVRFYDLSIVHGEHLA